MIKTSCLGVHDTFDSKSKQEFFSLFDTNDTMTKTNTNAHKDKIKSPFVNDYPKNNRLMVMSKSEILK